MSTQKLHPGDTFPQVKVTLIDDSEINLGKSENGLPWQAIFVYRGKHCPICTSFLNELEEVKSALADAGIGIIAVSGDSKAQLEEHMTSLNISYPIAYGLTEESMQDLGLYISKPRFAKETDHNFSEPGLFVVNEHGKLHVIDIANNPVSRPNLKTLVGGLAWIRDPKNDYPIRGTLNY